MPKFKQRFHLFISIGISEIYTIWDPSLISAKGPDLVDFTKLNNLIENIHLKFLKHCCGTDESSSNWGILSETGRQPLMIFVFQHMAKFWWHLKNSESHIIMAALNTNKVVSDTNPRSWFASLRKSLEWIGCGDLL